MKVVVPSQLRGYTAGQAEVEATGATLDAVFDDLDRRFPGFRFRVIDEQRRLRRHILVFLGEHRTDDLDTPVLGHQTVTIVGALSGG
ncbi:MAG: MoaD/ThiS family protein [Deltaproteobacteria bacterium]|nr:MoaD/ThiS family protein [Deltaproteobacteria bacterium]